MRGETLICEQTDILLRQEFIGARVENGVYRQKNPRRDVDFNAMICRLNTDRYRDLYGPWNALTGINIGCGAQKEQDFSVAFSQTWTIASVMILSMRALISSLQKKLAISCTHSEVAGSLRHLRYRRQKAPQKDTTADWAVMASDRWTLAPSAPARRGASALTGYLAFKRRRDQNIHLQTRERIAGDGSAPGNRLSVCVLSRRTRERLHVPAAVALTALRYDPESPTRAPAPANRRGFAADVTKTLNRNASAFNGDIRPTRGFQPTLTAPRPVAFTASEPPRWIGLPVTTPVTVVP